ncbi:SET domain-containing protein [Marinilongibacter aquaticus]|uniref:SET domain-containing protein n=1 Tax=Marinilongibacter aquaticus TaxID=2975157 RepID=UPI0021BD6DC2|nr:SET domain-containing protein [Marinilongibacter aquaticus]UBM60624.1 SET domain-containing protein [Marinilongibacter aquaticus]
MIHPNTQLLFINEQMGYGVFATAFIPEGTITYVKDALEITIKPDDYAQFGEGLKEAIDKYSYIDQNGDRIVSWDFAKYVNHCCQCNTMSTGYGFEIAIRDIHAGEQITDEYGLFNLTEHMSVACGLSPCRQSLGPEDFEKYSAVWDEKIRQSIHKIFEVEQALFPLIDQETANKVHELRHSPETYQSVFALKYKRETATV